MAQNSTACYFCHYCCEYLTWHEDITVREGTTEHRITFLDISISNWGWKQTRRGANWCLLSRDRRKGKSMELRFASLLPLQDKMPCKATRIVKLNITKSESWRCYTPYILSLRINYSQFRIIFCGLLLSQHNWHCVEGS